MQISTKPKNSVILSTPKLLYSSRTPLITTKIPQISYKQIKNSSPELSNKKSTKFSPRRLKFLQCKGLTTKKTLPCKLPSLKLEKDSIFSKETDINKPAVSYGEKL